MTTRTLMLAAAAALTMTAGAAMAQQSSTQNAGTMYQGDQTTQAPALMGNPAGQTQGASRTVSGNGMVQDPGTAAYLKYNSYSDSPD